MRPLHTFAVAFTLCLSTVAWAKGNAVACEQKCDAGAKVCQQQCVDRFPKDKQAGCKKACASSSPMCQAHCRGEK